MSVKKIIIEDNDTPLSECEYQRTLEDDLVLLEIVKRDGLELNPDGTLYKLAKEMHYI